MQWDTVSLIRSIYFVSAVATSFVFHYLLPLAVACQVLPGLYVGRCPGELKVKNDVFMSFIVH